MDFPSPITKKALAKYRSLQKSGKLSRKSDHGIALAYSLWLANARRGTLLAGMELTGRNRAKQTKARFAHMVYRDEQGETWDQGGRRASRRHEMALHPKNGIRRATQADLPLCCEGTQSNALMCWLEVHPANLPWFAGQWTRHGLQTSDALRMMAVLMQMEGAPAPVADPRQLGLLYPDEDQPNPELAPLDSAWYAQLAAPRS